MKNKKRNSKGISPIIATVLLIGIALVAFIFILAWTRGFIKESVSKFSEPIENSCSRVSFTSTISDDSQTVYINNQGNVPIYGFNVELSSLGKTSTQFIRPADGTAYAGASDSIGVDMSGKSVSIVPVLLGQGQSSGAAKLYPCTTQSQTLR